jgi:hypothetical protein
MSVVSLSKSGQAHIRYMTTPSFYDDEELYTMMSKYATGQPLPLVFHDQENDDELEYQKENPRHIKNRDFKTRLYISNLRSHKLGTALLRTYHSDIASHSSDLSFIRDLYKAYHQGNHPVARMILMRFMKVCFHADRTDYYSLAATIASGLSNCGDNTSFEICDDLIGTEGNVDAARKKLMLLMDIMFTNLTSRTFFIDKSGTNVYRVAYVSSDLSSQMLAVFTFLLQICLTAYAVLSVTNNFTATFDNDKLYTLLPLACMSSLYSASLVISELSNYEEIRYFYGKRCNFYFLIDLFITLFIPLVLLVAGFFLILEKDDYIEGVINTAALLFILNLDESVSFLLDYAVVKENVESFLLQKGVEGYNQLTQIKGVEEKIAKIGRIDFCDYYLTNTTEGGSDEKHFFLFQPFAVTFDRSDYEDHSMKPCEIITVDCLYEKIEWRYSNTYPNTSNPFISSLKLTKLNQPGQVIELPCRNAVRDEETVEGSEEHSLSGIFIITNFQSSSNHVTNLRVCGSTAGAADFIRGVDYYSLWPLGTNARKLLKRRAGGRACSC